MRGSLSALDIPINNITVAKIEYIYKNSVSSDECLLFNFTHHTGYGYIGLFGNAKC